MAAAAGVACGLEFPGRGNRWERRTFLEALGADDVLPPGQKTKVRGRIEAWFREDG